MKINGRRFTDQSGYSLPEMLIVVAIIGIISLVTVPAFINLQKSNKIKTSAREFNTTLRAARQRAVTTNMQTKVGFETGNRAKLSTCLNLPKPCQRRYTLYTRPNPTSADPRPDWVEVEPNGLLLPAGVSSRRPRQTDDIVYFDNSSTATDVDDISGEPVVDGENDIIFRSNGTVLFTPNTVTERTIVLRAMANIPFNEYTVTLRTTGNLTTARTRF